MGDPGIEPGVGLPGGVTVRCRTLQPVALDSAQLPKAQAGVKGTKAPLPQLLARAISPLRPSPPLRMLGPCPVPVHQRLTRDDGSDSEMKKPDWVIDKERAKRASSAATLWLFGLHAVEDALKNPARHKLRLILTRNAADKLAEAVAASGMEAEISDPRKFAAPLDAQAVHQGAALEVRALDWGDTRSVCAPTGARGLVVMLDRVSDPHNVGAVLRSAEVFGAQAVIATQRHAAPETGALAKTASGALERQPYLRVRNLAEEMEVLKSLGYVILGLDGTGEVTLADGLAQFPPGPIAIVLGAEGPGLRDKTRDTCDLIVRIPAVGDFGSLNVSNAAAVGLYAARMAQGAG